MIISVLSIIIAILVIACLVLTYKYVKLKQYLYDEQDMFLYNRNKISMIEYTYRKFKEGQNAFTTLRQMSDILKDIYKSDIFDMYKHDK